MAINRRKKNTRQRGSTTHGFGGKKKHRGHGSRGGSGLGGTGKRADSKKPSFWQAPYFGRHGFNRNVTLKPMNSINIKEIEKNLEGYLTAGLIQRQADTYTIDLEKLGFQKLLGAGKATHKLIITAKFASKKAAERIKSAGGEIKSALSGE